MSKWVKSSLKHTVVEYMYCMCKNITTLENLKIRIVLEVNLALKSFPTMGTVVEDANYYFLFYYFTKLIIQYHFYYWYPELINYIQF